MANIRSAWGIDIGNRALKAIHLTRTGEGIKIDDFELIEHEHVLSQAGDNREALIQSALANFAQRHNVKRAPVAVGVSGQASFARFIKLPPVEPKKIPEIVRFEAIQQIPFPLDDVEWSYQLFQDDQSPDVEVGIFAMRKELVNQHIAYFTQTGLNVEVVQMNPLAVYNAMYYDRRLSGATMIVDLGAENTDLIIAEGETVWLRSVPIGGNAFTEALVKQFKLKFAKAEELKRNAATSKYGRQILQAMRPVFADLVAEIQRSMGFYSSVHRDSRIQKILALGGTFRLPGLQKYLQQNLQLELVRIDHLEAGTPNDARLAAAFGENILSCVSAYGLALQAMGQGKIGSSLLPAHIRRQRMWKEKTKWFAASAAVFCMGTAVPVAMWYFSDVKIKQDLSTNGPNNTQVISQAQKFDNDWKAITDAGVADRKQIADISALQQDREFWNYLIPSLYAAFIPPASDNAAELLKTPRTNRQDVLLDAWRARYLAPGDFATIMALADDEFRMQADLDFSVGAGSAMRGGARGGPSGAARPGAAPAPTAAGDPATQRGYFLTLRCVTPNARASSYVAQTVVATLRNLGSSSKNPPERFRFERVVMVNEQKIGTDQRFGQKHTAKKGLFVKPSPDLAVGGPLPPGGGAGGFVPMRLPGAAPPVNPDAADPYKDTITGEDMKNDSIVTVVAAVMMDPPPPTPNTDTGKASVAAGVP